METNTEILSKKNTLAFQQAIKDQNEQISLLKEQVKNLIQTIQTLNARLDSLEQVNRVQKATIFGHGPSVKE